MPNSNTLDANALYLMHLMSCALRGEAPMALPEGASWDAVFALAMRNSVATTCSFAVAKAPGVDAAEAKRWRDETYKNAVRHALFAEEREAIFSAMDEAGLAHLPVKGTVTAAAYPRPEMRWMCDNDFLFGRDLGDGHVRVADHEDNLAMRRIMEARGFEAVEFELSKCDEYHKAPIFDFEPHRQLINPESQWLSYFKAPWAKAIRDSGAEGLAYKLSNEDMYIFLTLHTRIHYGGAGHGVRGIADTWAFLRAWREDFDWAYVKAELAKLGLTDLEASLRRTSGAVIDRDACGRVLAGDDGALAQKDAGMLAYMLGSGTYGNPDNFFSNAVGMSVAEHGRVGGRIRYLWSRLFPPLEKIRPYYPVLQHAPWLLPAVHLYRFTVRAAQKRDRVRTELDAVRGRSDK